MYSATVNPRVRQQCVTTLLKLVHFSSSEVLTDTLRDLPFSSFVATLLATHDLGIVVTGLQLAATCLRKLPAIFRGYFRREGVAHEMEQLATGAAVVVRKTPTATPTPTTASGPAGRSPNLRAASSPDAVAPSADPVPSPSARSSYVRGVRHAGPGAGASGKRAQALGGSGKRAKALGLALICPSSVL